MPYINTIDINGVIYTLENLTDGNNIVTLPELSKDDIFVLQGNIVNNTSSSSTIQPLSANQGRVLRNDLNAEIQNRINDVNLEEERATEAERILTANLNKEIADREADVNAEETRATNAENTLTTNLNAEIARAKKAEADELARAQAAEKVLTDNLAKEVADRTNDVDTEETRAKAAEKTLTDNLSKEIEDRKADVDAEEARALAAEKTLTDNLSAEVTRATNKENEINIALTNEISRATGVENTLTSNLNAEITRAKSAENTNATAISTEKSRAEGVESGLASRIATMEAFFKEADIDASQDFIDTLKEIQSYIASDKTGAAAMAASIQANATAIADEKSRAEGVEKVLTDNLSAEIERANNAEGTLQSNINAEATTARAAEKANADAIAILNGSSDGSVTKAIADAKTELTTEINKKLDKSDKYVHPSYDVHESGLYKIAVDEFGHISSVVAVSKDDIVSLGIPARDTTYEDATADTSGLLSATDKVAYDGYATTIENLQSQIDALRTLIESYHGVVEEPETPEDPEEPIE